MLDPYITDEPTEHVEAIEDQFPLIPDELLKRLEEQIPEPRFNEASPEEAMRFLAGQRSVVLLLKDIRQRQINK